MGGQAVERCKFSDCPYSLPSTSESLTVSSGYSSSFLLTQLFLLCQLPFPDALLKKTKRYDPNIRFWIGNPGSWAWLTDQRPYPNATCENPDDWIYGIGGNVTKVSKYGRKDVMADKQAVIDRFRSRNVHYALGLLDDGPGDTHCQARMQGEYQRLIQRECECDATKAYEVVIFSGALSELPLSSLSNIFRIYNRVSVNKQSNREPGGGKQALTLIESSL